MQYRIQLITISDDGEVLFTTEVAKLDKGIARLEDIGLNRQECKRLVQGAQQAIVEDQIQRYLDNARRCPDCTKPRRIKEDKRMLFRTLFGNVSIPNPRLRRCKCQNRGPRTWRPLKQLLTAHTAPEFQLIQAKWASLVPYVPVVRLLKDVLPVDEKLSSQAVHNTVMSVGRHLEEDRLAARSLGESPSSPPSDPDESVMIGVDGAYLKVWRERRNKFEAVVGKVSSEHGGDRCFGFIASQDPYPDVRSLEALLPHGIDESSEIYWLSDGEEGLRQYQWPFSRNCTFVLDWFHIGMRFQWLEQLARGLVSVEPDSGRHLLKELEHAKWCLWHGRLWDCSLYLETLDIGSLPEDERVRRLWDLAKELSFYLDRNRDMLVNYCDLYHDDRPISTAPVESAVNYLAKKRFSKKQQMGWTEAGAHHLLQVRAQTLNDELEGTFQRWYPGLMAA